MSVGETAIAGDKLPHYDRDLLLSPAKRDQIIELWEVEKFGVTALATPTRSRATA